jgi:TatD DNase family protein
VLDIHTHHPRRSADPLNVEIWSRALLHDPLPEPSLGAPLSVGWHPWYLTGDAALWEQQLLEAASRTDVVAIGECGLDKVCNTPWEQQLYAFDISRKVAALCEKPLILHVVRAYEEVLSLKWTHRAQYPDHTSGWVIHGFSKHPQVAQSLVKAGFYLSFGAALLRDDAPAAQAMRQVPHDRIFLETDAQTTVNIEQIYERAAAILEIPIADLIAQIEANWEGVVGGI